MLVIGVDGGATKTVGVALLSAGSEKKVVGRGSAGSSNRNSVSCTVHQMKQALHMLFFVFTRIM